MRKWAKRRKKVLAGLGLLLASPLLSVGVCNAVVLVSAKGHVFSDPAEIPVHRVAIVLGTSPRYNHATNPYFAGRIDAAAKLYKAGRVQRILVSGDNSSFDYDEPTAMQKALVREGIPIGHICKDYAGFRTLDSMVRAKKVFGLDDATVVTDDFHLPRSMYYAQCAGIRVDGFPAAHLPNSWTRNLRYREALARCRAVLDTTVLQTGPKFLGKPEQIP